MLPALIERHLACLVAILLALLGLAPESRASEAGFPPARSLELGYSRPPEPPPPRADSRPETNTSYPRYRGQLYDAQTGQIYLRNRYYSPEIGRFTSPDPKGYVDGPNLYNYCGGDPVNNWDPMGTDYFVMYEGIAIEGPFDDDADDLAEKMSQFYRREYGLKTYVAFFPNNKYQERNLAQVHQSQLAISTFEYFQGEGKRNPKYPFLADLSNYAAGRNMIDPNLVSVGDFIVSLAAPVGPGVGAVGKGLGAGARWLGARGFELAAKGGAAGARVAELTRRGAAYGKEFLQGGRELLPGGLEAAAQEEAATAGLHRIYGQLRAGAELTDETFAEIQRLTRMKYGGQGMVAKAGEYRQLAGEAVGGTQLAEIAGTWLRGTHGNAGLIPGQIAAKLRGQSFSSFDEFRSTFWKTVAGDADLSAQFSSSNVARMQQGLAPRVVKSQQYGDQLSYILHHRKPIHAGGGVYDLDNLWVVTPRLHQAILEGSFHFGR